MGHEMLTLRSGTYYSGSLKREQPYAYLLPAKCDEGQGQRYPLLVLLHGHGGSHLDWPTYTRIRRYALRHRLCIAFPEGGDGWYANSYDGSAAYEDDLIEDFVPHLVSSLPLLPAGRHWGIGGLSMGGYGAIKTALKRPRLFSVGLSHSGSFEAPRRSGSHAVFGDPDTNRALRRSSNVYALAEEALCRWPIERPRLFIDCGTEDELIASSRAFHDHLVFIGYHHMYREMPGHHTWPYWDRALRTLLPEVESILKERRDGDTN